VPRCSERFTTFEDRGTADAAVVKSDGSREPFDERKLRTA
jgi:transcriptional repressor NrdR